MAAGTVPANTERNDPMTQYLLSVHSVEGAPLPSPAQTEKISRDVDAFNAELRTAGAWVFAGGLHPASTATVAPARDGEVVTTDGPFAESKEQVGGFWVITTPDLDAALTLACSVTSVCTGLIGRGMFGRMGCWSASPTTCW